VWSHTILKYSGVWVSLVVFCFNFYRKLKNGDENIFSWIFENIFSENNFSNEPKNENNQI